MKKQTSSELNALIAALIVGATLSVIVYEGKKAIDKGDMTIQAIQGTGMQLADETGNASWFTIPNTNNAYPESNAIVVTEPMAKKTYPIVRYEIKG